MKNYLLSFFLLILFAGSARSQVIEKISTQLLDGPDGITMDNKGNLFIANWGKDGKGTSVIKIDCSGKETLFADSLSSPDGLTFDKNNNLYISCWASGEIIKLTPERKKKIIATGLDHPSDLKFDSKGNLFVSSFGNFNGTKIYKTGAGNNISIFADSLNVPLGLAFDKADNLYVSNFATGAISKISPTGQKSLYAQLPAATPGYFQYLAFDDTGNLYCPSFGHNCIYKIEKAQKVSRLVAIDKDNTKTELNGPNSICIRNGHLYFSEFNTNSIYKLKL